MTLAMPQTPTLPTRVRRCEPPFTPHADPACPTCGLRHPTLHENLDGSAYTGCCQADPVAFVCAEAGVNVYLSPEGDEPEICPHCPE
ncbi:hypothetical protein [Nonomuraea recticatena]|uniref:Uncharacterized protein n=1 Tax=Nonomuraea recticatena TaxID=46178 RepID=A0ABP6FGP1_9ACTN